MAEVDANIGEVYERKEDWDNALKRHRDSVESFERMGNKSQLWNTYLNYARVLARVGDLEHAEDVCNKSKQILHDLGNQRGFASLSRVEGIIASKKAEWETAIHKFTHSAGLCQESKDPYGHGETLREKAQMYLSRNEKTMAISVLNEAEDVFKEIGAHGDVYIIKKQIGLIESSMRDNV